MQIHFLEFIKIHSNHKVSRRIQKKNHFVVIIYAFYMYVLDIHRRSSSCVRNIFDQMHLQVTQRSSIFQRYGTVYTTCIS